MHRAKSQTATSSLWYENSGLFIGRLAPALVHDYVGNRYYTSTSGEIAFPFTATRTTNATMFNSAGQLVWADTNLFLNTEDVGGTGWSLNASTALAGKIIPNGTVVNHGVNGATSSVVGVTYQCSVSAKADGYNYLHFRGMGSSSDGLVFNLSNGTVLSTTGGWVNGTITAESGGYYRCTGEMTALSTTVLQLFVSPDGTFATYAGDTTSGVTITRAQLRPIPSISNVYVANTSTSLAYYGPRFDYNPATLTPRGILVEGSGTNILAYSRDTSNVLWTKTDTTFATTLTDISGVANAARLATEGPTATAIVHVGGTVTAGATITASIVLKSTGASPVRWIRIICCDGAITDGYDGWFDIQNGVKGSVAARGAGTAGSSAMVPLGNGWYRCSVTCTPNGVYTTGRMCINSASFDGSGARVANATYGIDHAQVEAGSCSTSIIPTFGTTATRSADIFNTTFSGYNASGGVIYANYEVPSMPLTVFPRIVGISDGTTDNKMHVSTVFATPDTAQGIMYVVTASLTEVNTGCPSVVPISNIRLGFRYKLNDFFGATNGGTGSTDFLATPIASANSLTLGQSFPTPPSVVRWIKSIRYYNDGSVTNAQIQSLTA